MIGSSSQFLGSLPVGSVIQSPVNISDPNYLRMDGSILVRATVPVFSAMCGNVGTFTPTIRPIAGALANSSIVTNGTTTLITGGSTSTTNTQVSTNGGVLWTFGTTGIASAFNGFVHNGTVFVGFPSNTIAPIYSTNGTTGWASSGAAIQTLATFAASQTTGTIIACGIAANSGPVFISTSAATPSFSQITTLAAGTVAGACASVPIVYTGTKWILFGYLAPGQGFQTSTTGASGTWSGVANPPWGMAAVSAAVSDGANNVLVVLAGSSIAFVSNDGGNTWRQTLLPSNASAGVNLGASYANGKWFVSLETYVGTAVTTSGDMAVSSDLLSWTLVPGISYTSAATNNAYTTQVAYQGSNYILVGSGNSTATLNTATENTAQMYLPSSRRPTISNAVDSALGAANYQEWIKVQ